MVNKVILQGRLTKDVELKQTQSGVKYTEVTVAWSEKIKENENKCFMRCKAWSHTAEFLDKYFCKGQELIIEGQMRTEEWQDKDGNKQSRLVCNVDKVHFCGSAKSNSKTGEPQSKSSFTEEVDDEDLPF